MTEVTDIRRMGKLPPVTAARFSDKVLLGGDSNSCCTQYSLDSLDSHRKSVSLRGDRGKIGNRWRVQLEIDATVT